MQTRLFLQFQLQKRIQSIAVIYCNFKQFYKTAFRYKIEQVVISDQQPLLNNLKIFNKIAKNNLVKRT